MNSTDIVSRDSHCGKGQLVIEWKKRRRSSVKKFEYKMAEIKTSLGFDWQKKIREAEARWNELGREGWQFCMHGNGVIVFMREIEE